MSRDSLKQSWLYVAICIWQVVFFGVSYFGQGLHAGLINAVSVVSLVFLPGLITSLIFRLEKLTFFGFSTLSVAFSLLEIMFFVLLGNTVLPHYGIPYPLEKDVLLAEFAILVNGLFSILVASRKTPAFGELPQVFTTRFDAVIALFPAIFPVMAIAGAIVLNNGGDGMVTLVMLFGITAYLSVLLYYAKRLGPNVIPIALSFIAMALLLMTSLRGWYTTGHDIQREYRVFLLTKSNGFWSIDAYRDAYNACMSITILPTVFSNVMRVFDPYIFKALYQMIFALFPGTIYMILRQYTGQTLALVASIYVIAFPTFFGDMPFLNRQEIAFLFFALMTYILLEPSIPLMKRKLIFVLLGIGMILSHYSTTYTAIALFLFTAGAHPFLLLARRIFHRLRIFALFKNSGFELLNESYVPSKRKLTIWMVMVLVLATFFWTALFTDTASRSIGRVLKATVSVMLSNTAEDARSSDVGYNLFARQHFSSEEFLENYHTTFVWPIHASSSRAYFSTEVYTQHPITVAPESRLPLTVVGGWLQKLGIHVQTFNDIVREVSAKGLQILVLIGFLVLAFSYRHLTKLLDTELVLFATGSILFIAAQVLLPVLSAEYGLLRAFQQSLIFLSIFIAIGSTYLLPKVGIKFKMLFAASLAILFFASSTGVITQTLGGYGAQLHLNNSGHYYDIYYLHRSEIVAATWVSEIADQENLQIEVQSDAFTTSLFKKITDFNPINSIYPYMIRKSSYVYVGHSIAQTKRATLSYQGTQVTYTYPLEFIDARKDLIYNSTFVRIYK